MTLRRLFPLALLAAAWPVFASGSDVVGENLLWLTIILLAARLFAPLAQKIGFPAVLGELLLGVLLGNLGLLGFHYFDRPWTNFREAAASYRRCATAAAA